MPDTSFHETETLPTPMPGAKTSTPDKPPVTGVNDSNSSRTAPQRDTGDKDRGNALHDHMAAYFAPKETRVGPKGQTVTDVVDEAVKNAPNLDQ
jgi:hypothetical protein